MGSSLAALRRDVFQKIQFDEAMDWGFEDVDLGWSITRAKPICETFSYPVQPFFILTLIQRENDFNVDRSIA